MAIKNPFKKNQKDENELTRPVKKYKGLGKMDVLKMRMLPRTTFLITMRHRNGTKNTFSLQSTKNTFKYKGGSYFLHPADAWFNANHREYELDYHIDCPVPLSKSYHKEIDKDEKGTERQKAFWHVTPHNLKQLIMMEYVKAMAQALEMSRYLKFTMLFSVVSATVSIINMVMIYRK